MELENRPREEEGEENPFGRGYFTNQLCLMSHQACLPLAHIQVPFPIPEPRTLEELFRSTILRFQVRTQGNKLVGRACAPLAAPQPHYPPLPSARFPSIGFTRGIVRIVTPADVSANQRLNEFVYKVYLNGVPMICKLSRDYAAYAFEQELRTYLTLRQMGPKLPSSLNYIPRLQGMHAFQCSFGSFSWMKAELY